MIPKKERRVLVGKVFVCRGEQVEASKESGSDDAVILEDPARSSRGMERERCRSWTAVTETW